jgi:hypothetical protein
MGAGHGDAKHLSESLLFPSEPGSQLRRSLTSANPVVDPDQRSAVIPGQGSAQINIECPFRNEAGLRDQHCKVACGSRAADRGRTKVGLYRPVKTVLSGI